MAYLPKWDGGGGGLYHATQNYAQCKSYELVISGIFHLIFSDHHWPRVTEAVESETMAEGRLL